MPELLSNPMFILQPQMPYIFNNVRQKHQQKVKGKSPKTPHANSSNSPAKQSPQVQNKQRQKYTKNQQ
jgi:hypothetical protein